MILSLRIYSFKCGRTYTFMRLAALAPERNMIKAGLYLSQCSNEMAVKERGIIGTASPAQLPSALPILRLDPGTVLIEEDKLCKGQFLHRYHGQLPGSMGISHRRQKMQLS